MVDYFSACSAEVNQALQATGTDTSTSGWPSGSAVSKEAHAALAKNGARKQEKICEQSLVSKIDKNFGNVGMIVVMSGHQLSDACATQTTWRAVTADSRAAKVQRDIEAAQADASHTVNVSAPASTPSPVSGATDFQCNTTKHTVIIDHLTLGQYRYRAWNKPKAPSGTPDMQVQSGTVEVSGTGECRHSDYTFKNGNVVFTVSNDINCGETAPAANVNGWLSVDISVFSQIS
jgi:hypothetical protein